MQTLPSASVGVTGHKSSQAVHYAALACEHLLIMREQEGQENGWKGRTSPSTHPHMLGLPAQAVDPVSILGSHCAGFGCQKRFAVSAQDVQGAKAKPVRNGEAIPPPWAKKGVTPVVMRVLSTFLAFKVGFSLTCAAKYVFS